MLEVIFVVGVSGCFFFDLDFFEPKCAQHVPQKYRFGYKDVDISTSRRKLHIGDTIFVRTRINQFFFDSLSKSHITVKGGVTLFFRLTLAVYGTNSSPFAIDTTIHRVFDQYFDTVVKTGVKKKTYYFGCSLVDGYWELDMAFIARRKGVYEIYPSVIEVLTGEALPKGTCMLGDSEKFGTRIRLVGKNNRIGEVYPLLTQPYDEFFGFFIE